MLCVCVCVCCVCVYQSEAPGGVSGAAERRTSESEEQALPFAENSTSSLDGIFHEFFTIFTFPSNLFSRMLHFCQQRFLATVCHLVLCVCVCVCV